MNDAQHKTVAVISLCLAVFLLTLFGAHELRVMKAAKVTDLSFETRVQESGDFSVTVGEEKLTAPNALWHDGQKAFLNTYLRFQPAPEGCWMFLLGPSLASTPAKATTMGQLAAHEPTAIQNPGYVRKRITFNAPLYDAVSDDYYVASPTAAWTKEERSFTPWLIPVSWIGVVCGAEEQAGVVNDTNGTIVSLAQVVPTRPVGANDTISASYKVFQR